MERMIELKNIHKSFDGVEVLKGVDLTINKGETVALLGSSGSGKSTLLRCINLLETPDQGSVSIGDFTFTSDKIDKHVKLQARQSTAMVFQNFCLFANKTALENVMEALIVVKKMKKAHAMEIARQYLDKVGLLAQADQYPSTLSGGQKQRVAISRALALEPKVILFDEPTSALDPELVHEVQLVIESLAKEKVTMCIVTHEMSFARNIADRVAFMSEGQILEYNTPERFFNAPETERTRQFIERYMDSLRISFKGA